jgi:putative oxidoreductase
MNASHLSTLAARGYGLLAKCASALACPLLLIIRVYWGWQFFGTGKGKLMDIQKVSGFFACRLTTIPLIFTMIVAYVTVESDSLKAIFTDPDKFTGATPFLFLFACVIVFVFGPGVFSLDWVIGKIYAKQVPAAALQPAVK